MEYLVIFASRSRLIHSNSGLLANILRSFCTAALTRRSELGFIYIGCRFNEQMLRTYARQISKRSKGPHFAVMQGDRLTRNERRFLAEYDIMLIDMSLDCFAGRLIG